MEKRVKTVLAFLKPFVGTRYKWWTPKTDMTLDRSPFWSVNDPVPRDIDGIACTGLLNLVMRKLGMSIPGTERPGYRFPGGTWIWFHTLKKRGVLQRFDASFSYPAGTLLLAPHKNDHEQGHVAIIYKQDNANVYDSLIIHSYSETPYTPRGGYSDPGVVIYPSFSCHRKASSPMCVFLRDG